MTWPWAIFALALAILVLGLALLIYGHELVDTWAKHAYEQDPPPPPPPAKPKGMENVGVPRSR